MLTQRAQMIAFLPWIPYVQLSFSVWKLLKWIGRLLKGVGLAILSFGQYVFSCIQTVLDSNKSILAKATRVCARLHNLGEVLLIVAAFMWIAWPFLLPLILGSFVMCIPAGLVTAALIRSAVNVVRENWRKE